MFSSFEKRRIDSIRARGGFSGEYYGCLGGVALPLVDPLYQAVINFAEEYAGAPFSEVSDEAIHAGLQKLDGGIRMLELIANLRKAIPSWQLDVAYLDQLESGIKSKIFPES